MNELREAKELPRALLGLIGLAWAGLAPASWLGVVVAQRERQQVQRLLEARDLPQNWRPSPLISSLVCLPARPMVGRAESYSNDNNATQSEPPAARRPERAAAQLPRSGGADWIGPDLRAPACTRTTCSTSAPTQGRLGQPKSAAPLIVSGRRAMGRLELLFFKTVWLSCRRRSNNNNNTNVAPPRSRPSILALACRKSQAASN